MIDKKYLEIEKEQRVLILSDVHGSLELFKKALRKLKFNKGDVLIINGDISEKGLDSIGLFRYIIELQKSHNVYGVLGNCDHLINHFNQKEFNEGMSHYMKTRRMTLLNEIKAEMGGEPSYLERVAYMNQTYPEIIKFVSEMPLVLETQYFICTHAALRENGEIDRLYNTQERDFFNSPSKFDKPVIVGHYPVCLYDDEMINHNVRMDFDKNIIAIDGANRMKRLGQLNILVFENGKFSSTFVDDLEYVEAYHDQEEIKGTHINWANNGISIVEEGPVESLVHHPYSGKDVYVNNYFLDLDNGSLNIDTTDSYLPIKKGDLIHIQFQTEDKMYIKSNGYEGWYRYKK